MSRWKCLRCDRRPLRPGNRGITAECKTCGGTIVCLGQGIDLDVPDVEDRIE